MQNKLFVDVDWAGVVGILSGQNFTKDFLMAACKVSLSQTMSVGMVAGLRSQTMYLPEPSSIV